MNNKINLYTWSIAAVLILILSSCSSNPDSPGSEYMPDMYRSPAIEIYVDYGEIRGREDQKVKNTISARQTPKYTVPYERIYTKELVDLKKKRDDLESMGDTAATVELQIEKLTLQIEKLTLKVQMMLPNKIKAGIGWRESHGLYGWDLASENGYDKARLVTVNPLTMTPDNADQILKNGEKLYTSMCAHCHGEKGDGNGPMIKSGAYGDLGVVPAYKALDTLSEGKIFYSIYYGKGYMGAHGSLLNKKEIWTLVHYVRQFQREGYGKFEDVAEVIEEQ